MTKKADGDKLEALHGKLADIMSVMLDEPEVSPATLNAVRQFLRDNHVESTANNTQTDELLKQFEEMSTLPFDGEVPKEYKN